MSTWLPRQRTILVAMVICLGSWGVHAWPHDAATHYHKKHLKGALGRLVPAGSSQPQLEGQLRIGPGPDITEQDNGEITLFQEMDLPTEVNFHPVSVDYFRVMVDRAESYHDVLRLFLGEDFTDAEIDQIMTKERDTSRTEPDGRHFRDITLEGTQSGTGTAIVPYYNVSVNVKPSRHLHSHRKHDDEGDVMLADQPAVCSTCISIQHSGKFINSPKVGVLSSDKRQPDELTSRRRRHNPSKKKRRKSKLRTGDLIPQKKCKKRRKELSQRIVQCKRKNNRSLCKKLRDRYKKLRRRCKQEHTNHAVPPTSKPITLPAIFRPTPASTPALTSSPTVIDDNMEYPKDFLKWQVTKEDTRRNAQCGLPVAETVRIRDITHRGDKEYVPSCVVRYRCRSDCGCCPQGYMCGTKSSVNITKSILEGQLDTEKLLVGDVTVKHFQIQNDTACGCQPMEEYTLRPCPYPFDYSLDQCKCRSKSLEDHCRKIRHGNERLEQSDIQCIKEGRCRPLDESVCEHFIIDEGRCLKKGQIPTVLDEG